ncbi:MAG: hypothetical protein CM1200mP2_18490 [Planctomycetaceae bacterium]|nr:MAG: hypothetical protein CM1200mP2_18490 [Planctomycetaceae bacterium]
MTAGSTCAPPVVSGKREGQDIQAVAGVPTSVAADFDNDGLVDLFSWSARKLYHNDGEMKFTAVKLPELPRRVPGACWGDFNGDGLSNLHRGLRGLGQGHHLAVPVLISQKGKSFKLALSKSQTRARGVTACDFDQDGDLDVYVSSYRSSRTCSGSTTAKPPSPNRRRSSE